MTKVAGIESSVIPNISYVSRNTVHTVGAESSSRLQEK